MLHPSPAGGEVGDGARCTAEGAEEAEGEASCHCEGAQRPQQAPVSAQYMPEGMPPVLAGDCFAAVGGSQ